jgi:hypothetical protein
MFYKLQKIFETLTEKTGGKITDLEHLNYLIKRLLDGKLMIEHDVDLIHKYIIDFPLNFEQFCSYLSQIYKLEIEKKMLNKINEFNSIFTRLTQFFSHFGYENLTNDDLYEILSNFDKAKMNIEHCLKTTKKIEFLLKNIRDEIQKILWTPILENIPNQNEVNNPDFFIVIII